MKKYPFTNQSDLKGCGPACLSMIVKYYGGFISLENLSNMMGTNKDGTTAYQMIETAQKIGFEANGLKVPLEQLKEISTPFIAHVIINNYYSHFIVVYEVKDKIIIGDPASKVKKISWDEFQKIYQNVILTFYPIHKIPFYKQEKYFENSLKKMIKSNYKIFLILIIFSVLISIFSFAESIYLKIIMDKIFYGETLVYLFILFVIFSSFKNKIEWFQNKMYLKLEKKLDYELTIDIFSKIILLPYCYYKNKTTGDIVARFKDITKIKETFSKIFIILFVDFILSGTSLIILFSISKWFTLILIFFSLFLISIILFYKNKVIKEINNLKQQQGVINSCLIESITGFESIKGNHLEQNVIAQFKKLYNDYLKYYSNLNHLKNNENYLKNLIIDICIITIIFLGSLFMKDLANLILYITLIPFLLTPIKDILENLEDFRETKISIERINELMIGKERKIKKGNLSSIEIKNLNIIQKNKCILSNINLKILKEDKIIFVGESGCGKSSLLKLIKGYEISPNILYSPKPFYHSISYLSQNEFLFTNTIYYNIVMGRNINNDEFEKVCKICFVDEIILKSSLGINTLIEENGFNLSGGEKQRIVLARSLLSNSNILLIDEGLSEVDLSMERKILKNIFKAYPNKIIIFVSHRMDNADLFNKLWKIENEKINEIIKSK